MNEGRFLRFGPPAPHECVLPDAVDTGERCEGDPTIPWPAAWRLPLTGDEWQCGFCSRVYRYRSARTIFGEGRWKFIRNPGFQVPDPVDHVPPMPTNMRPNPSRATR